MSSLIPGYEYDIFISYRQKDNKYDGWVTEFAGNLKKELDATFKDEVSVYFDINPHDGLLEPYEVNDFLKEKLKYLENFRSDERFTTFIQKAGRILESFNE